MTTTTTPHPYVPVPVGIEMVSDWDIDGYRDIFGVDRTVTDHTARVYALGSQDTGGTISGVVVFVDEEDGSDHVFDINSDQARELAAALLEAADELDRWFTR